MTTPWISSIRPTLRFSVSTDNDFPFALRPPETPPGGLRPTLRLAGEPLGSRYDFQDFLGDLRLTLAVHLQREVLDDVSGVLRRVAHRGHARAVLGGGRLEQCAED